MIYLYLFNRVLPRAITILNLPSFTLLVFFSQINHNLKRLKEHNWINYTKYRLQLRMNIESDKDDKDVLLKLFIVFQHNKRGEGENQPNKSDIVFIIVFQNGCLLGLICYM